MSFVVSLSLLIAEMRLVNDGFTDQIKIPHPGTLICDFVAARFHSY